MVDLRNKLGITRMTRAESARSVCFSADPLTPCNTMIMRETLIHRRYRGSLPSESYELGYNGTSTQRRTRRHGLPWRSLRVVVSSLLAITLVKTSLNSHQQNDSIRNLKEATSIIFLLDSTHSMFYLPDLAVGRGTPDYGDLIFDLYAPVRQISDSHAKVFEDYMKHRIKAMDTQKTIRRKQMYSEDMTGPQECTRNSWMMMHFPTCNTMHEQTFERTYDSVYHQFDISYRASGYFRDVWVIENAKDKRDAFACKRLRHAEDFTYNHDIMFQIHKEAIILERLTGSPNIVDIYSFCGTSIAAEYMVSEITPDLVPTAGFMNQTELDPYQKDDVYPMNNLTLKEKLDYSIAMAESLADIHGFEDGVILHGDVHPDQWLKNADGRVKLNDFNNGDILEFSTNKNTYCPVGRCFGGTFRPPEELDCDGGTEQVDTFAFGNSLYALLTGLWPWYEYPDYNEYYELKARKLIVELKQQPFIDPRYRTRSRVESGLVAIMEQTWAHDPNNRISMFEALQQLYDLRDEFVAQ